MATGPGPLADPAISRPHCRVHRPHAWREIQTAREVEKFNMPSTVNPYLIGVWFCVGFFTGAGWAVAAWLVGRILSYIHI